MPRHNTAAGKELPEDLPQELRARNASRSAAAATCRPSRPSKIAPTQSCSLCYFRLQMGNREDNIAISLASIPASSSHYLQLNHGRPPGSRPTPSLPLAATKKLGVTLWAAPKEGCLRPSSHH